MVMATLHRVSFCGNMIESTVTNEAAVVDDWVHNIMCKHTQQKIKVGLDCKYKPHPIGSMSNKIATVQLCVDTDCLILQLFHMDSTPLSISNFLIDAKVVFFGVEIYDNAVKLWSEYGLKCSKKIDIRALAKIWFPTSNNGKPSLKAIAYEVAGLSVRKRRNCSECNWESRVLDEELIEFACVDAYASFRIAHELLKQR